MTQQEQHHTYVPGPRDGEHEDEQVAVGTAHAPYSDEDDERGEATYPASTYASGSADPDLADRDDVEVVDRDTALAEEDDEDERDEPRAVDDEVDAAYDNAVRENEVRDAEDTDENEPTGYTGEPAEDAGYTGTAGVEDERVEDEVATAEAEEDRDWAAEHATQLRAGSTDLDDEPAATDTQVVEPAADEPVSEEPVDAESGYDGPVDDETVAGETVAGETVAGEPVASTPGSVDVTAIGAVWTDGAVDGLRERWRELQLRFIDEPRSVADEADQLVGEAVETITNALQAQRQQLANWQNEPGDDTERLRAAVRGYRDYLDRLLGM